MSDREDQDRFAEIAAVLTNSPDATLTRNDQWFLFDFVSRLMQENDDLRRGRQKGSADHDSREDRS